MKKTRLFAVLLAVSLVVAAFCACLSVSAAKGDNLAKGKTYTGADPSKHPSNANYTANLTDGVAAEHLSFNSGVWFAFYYNKDATGEGYINAPNGVGTLVIDLGDTYPVDTVKVNTFLGNSSGILPPKSMKVDYSTDGENFTALCDAKTFEKPEGDPPIDKVENVEFKSGSSVNARYIQVTVELAATFAFIDEVQVLEGDPVSGGDTSADTPSDDSSADDSSAADTSSDDASADTSADTSTDTSATESSTDTSSTDSSAATSSTTETSSTATSSTTNTSSAATSSTTGGTSSASAPAESASSPAATSSTGPTTGDAGLIGFAVLMVVAISGVAIAVKVRK